MKPVYVYKIYVTQHDNMNLVLNVQIESPESYFPITYIQGGKKRLGKQAWERNQVQETKSGI